MITAYKCDKEGETLKAFEYQSKPLGPHDARIKITHCGICHSDLHLIDNDWSVSNYPLVPGHEIIGIVEEKGDRVHYLEIGQRVGIGWQAGSCMSCEWCLQGDENLCEQTERTCADQFGGFAKEIVSDARFAFPLPESLPSAAAAPLLCGGATVFTPFLNHKIGPTMHVAVLGIGGLGHLALQFARAIGCEVTALSSSEDKEAEAKMFGADHFICIKNPTTFETLKSQFDFILSSSTHGLEWAPTLNALRPKGKLCLLGSIDQTLELPVSDIIHGQRVVCGSNIGSRPGIKKMLTFAARHHILPQIEEFPMSQVNEAIAKLRAGKMRYRAVLFNDDL